MNFHPVGISIRAQRRRKHSPKVMSRRVSTRILVPGAVIIAADQSCYYQSTQKISFHTLDDVLCHGQVDA